MRNVSIIFLLWFLYGCTTEAHSQREMTDNSLILKTINTAFIDSMLDRGSAMLFQYPPDSTEPLFRYALKLSMEQSYIDGMAVAYGNLGLCLARKKEFNESVSCLKKAIGYSQLMNRQKRLNLLYTQLSTVYGLKGAFPEVIRLVTEVLPRYDLQDSLQRLYYLKLKDSRSRAYLNLGNTPLAYADMHDIIQEIKQPDSATRTMLASVYTGLSILASQMHKYDFSLKMATAVEKMGASFSDQYLLSHAWYNKASIYYNMNKLDKSLAYAMKSLAAYEDSYDILPYKASALRTIAGVLGKQGDYQQALKYALEAVRLDEQSGGAHNGSLIGSYTMLGNIYAALKDYDQAKQVLLKAEEITVSTSSFKINQLQTYKLQAEIYAADGDYRRALEYKDRYYSSRDSIEGDEMKARVSDAEARYSLAEKDRQIVQKELEAQRSMNRQYVWIGVSLLMLLALTGSVLYMKNRSALSRIKGMLDGEEQERKRIARELHDGVVSHLSIAKTNFSNLRDFQKGNEKMLDDAIRQLDQSIADLRNTSHNLLPDGLLQEGLIPTVEDYFRKINTAGKIHITLQVVDVLPPLTDSFQLNLYRIIQELIQNILKYAGATRILVQFNVYADTLTVTVEDNGHGRDFHSNAGAAGIGLANLEARIRLLSGEQEVESDPARGTTVYLTFPTGGL